MEEIRFLHRQAMDLAERGAELKMDGDEKGAVDFFSQAFLKEKQAAELVTDEEKDDLRREDLFRSAAILAKESGRLDLVEKMFSLALEGGPALRRRRRKEKGIKADN
jgi:hypothetical protein